MNWKQGDVAILVNVIESPQYNGTECLLLGDPFFAERSKNIRTGKMYYNEWLVRVRACDGKEGNIKVKYLRRKPPPETLGWAKFKVSNLIKTLTLKGGSKVVSPTDHA